MANGNILINWRGKQYNARFEIGYDNEPDDIIYTYADGTDIPVGHDAEGNEEVDDLHMAVLPILIERLRIATQPIDIS